MKIAVLSSHTPSLFWFRMDMMLGFKALGHDVIAIGNEPYDVWAEKFESQGIKYISAEISRNGTNPFKDLKTLKSLIADAEALTIYYNSIFSQLFNFRPRY